MEKEIRELEQFLRDHGYSEDVVQESIAAVREKFQEADIPTGPDTTENIKEVVNDLEMQDQGFELINSNEPMPDINPVDSGKDLLFMTPEEKRKYIDINGCVSDEPAFLSIPKDVADRIAAYEHGYHRTPRGGEHIQVSSRWGLGKPGSLTPEQYANFMEEWNQIEKYHKSQPREAANEEVNRWRAHNRFIPKKDTKGLKTVYPTIFDNILEQMSDLHARKNSDYGDSAYEGYKEFGITYYIIQLHNKLNRLKSLTRTDNRPQVNESLEDTLIDLAVYSVMALEALKRKD